MAGFGLFGLYGCSQRPAAPNSAPPAAVGYFYFSLQPVGSWRSLPSDSQCAARMHSSTWEPRPEITSKITPCRRLAPWRRHSACGHATKATPTTGCGTPGCCRGWTVDSPAPLTRFCTGRPANGSAHNLIRADAGVESTWFQYMHFPGNARAGGGAATVATGSAAAVTLSCRPRLALLPTVRLSPRKGWLRRPTTGAPLFVAATKAGRPG